MADLFPFLFVIIIFAVIGFSIYYSWRKEKDRTAALEQVARDRMFTFRKTGSDASAYQRFHLRARGRGHTVYNEMEGAADNVPVRLFDYRFTVGSGKNKRTYKQTVFEFESPQLNVVGFTIRPNQFWDGFRERFGKKSVEMHDETFNGNFNVYAHDDSERDHDAIRQLIDADVRHALLRQSNRMVIEGDGDRILIWRQNERVKPDAIGRAITDAKAIFDMLAEATGWSWEKGNKLTFGDDRGWEKQPDDVSFDDDWGGWKKQ